MNIDIFNTENKYDIIYADPPWSFKVWSNKGEGRSAESHYSTMSIQDIKQLPIKNLLSKNAALFIWVTFPTLDTSFDVMKGWGFKYKTCAFNWVKANKSADLTKLNVNKDIRMNMGYYTRANSELCLLADTEDNDDIVLLGTSGKVLPRWSKSVRQVIVTHQREHSRKPDEVYERIEQLFGPDTKKLELFARTQREGWDCWGNETNKF